EAALRLDWNLSRDTAGKKAKPVAGIVRRQARQMIKREICAADENGLQPWAADHASSGHEAAGANDVAAFGCLCHHRVQYGCVVVIVGRIYDYKWCIACRKSREHGAMRAAAAVADELDDHSAERAAILRDGR